LSGETWQKTWHFYSQTQEKVKKSGDLPSNPCQCNSELKIKPVNQIKLLVMAKCITGLNKRIRHQESIPAPLALAANAQASEPQ